MKIKRTREGGIWVRHASRPVAHLYLGVADFALERPETRFVAACRRVLAVGNITEVRKEEKCVDCERAR